MSVPQPVGISPYQELSIEAEARGQGAHRIVCPQCRGGHTAEASLSLAVLASGNFSFKCFRASCGWGGGNYGKREKPKKEPRYFTSETLSLNESRQAWLLSQFGVIPESTVYAPYMDRYVYEVVGPYLLHRGHIARAFDGRSPKVLTYNEVPDEPFLGWAFGSARTFTHVVIVEDWISAEKVACLPFAAAVALNGSHLSLEGAIEIRDRAVSLGNAQVGGKAAQVVLALDRDAYSKSLEFMNKYSNMFSPRMRVWMLDKDLKYVATNEIECALNDERFSFSAIVDNGTAAGSRILG